MLAPVVVSLLVAVAAFSNVTVCLCVLQERKLCRIGDVSDSNRSITEQQPLQTTVFRAKTESPRCAHTCMFPAMTMLWQVFCLGKVKHISKQCCSKSFRPGLCYSYVPKTHTHIFYLSRIEPNDWLIIHSWILQRSLWKWKIVLQNTKIIRQNQLT